VATSAARDAENVEEFMAAASSIVGTTTEVLSGDEEGRFSFAGATASLPMDLAGSGPILVVDIGGGSTELVVGVRSSAHVVSRSLDIGCVRMTERLFLHDPPWPEELARARGVVQGEVESARLVLPALAPDSVLVGLAGTVSTLACLERRLAVYQRDQVHHALIEREHVRRWLEVLAAEESKARLEHPGMVMGREEVIVAGILILDVVMESFSRHQCLVSEDDILDGLALDLLGGAAPDDHTV
jgi:exopolyphosphatase/guanosine-5'-triphosphate,3'-diphosphate pyrophosphatase